MSTPTRVIAIDAGNTRVHAGVIVNDQIEGDVSFAHADLETGLDRLAEWLTPAGKEPAPVVALASVDDEIAARLTARIKERFGSTVYRVGDDLAVPIGRRLDPETLTGVDRLLNAAAAYERVSQACIVVDAGTAVTVDFIDGEGTFHGGAIAPGARMQLDALHAGTAALPEVEFRRPADSDFGRSTAEAMLRGVHGGIRGMVWRLVEEYAEAYGAYPMVIATGGDAETLFGDDELIDRIVPSLTLLGIAVAVRTALSSEEASLEATDEAADADLKT